ncbi:cytochrome C [Lysobacter lacus]|uniref:Cytochrome C n=1 Tax=Cognatilysobacter lacus TaxID=1643323 RepID=A0A5D8Z7B4_9GAMM|nr:cytochrome C [Lysobacter lacus]
MGGFGPQLTPYGRQFKLSGYTLRLDDSAHLPLSAMMVESYTHTRQAQSEIPAKHFHRNDNVELRQASVFLAGRLGEHLGVFAQATYSQNGGLLGWDNAEVRYSRVFNGTKHGGVWGLTVNNNPGVTDVFNTAPAWQYPYIAPDLAPGAPAAPLLFGGLAGQVIGASAYVQVDGNWYAEAGAYRSLSPSFLRKVNAGYDGRVSGAAPYMRVNRTWNVSGGNLEVGGFVLEARRGLVEPDLNDHPVPVPGPNDRFRDVGVDASYQHFGAGTHTFTVNALLVTERQRLDATYAADGAENRDNSLQAMNVNGSYWYRNTWGATLGAFAYNGSADTVLYGQTGSPDTQGGTVELNWSPAHGAATMGAEDGRRAHVRLGAQYTFYTRFAGATHDVDGEGRPARANDTMFVYVWIAM